MKMSIPAQRVLLEVGYRLGGWPRRIAALFCLLLAGVAAASEHQPTRAVAQVEVVVVTRDLGAGATLAADDLLLVRWPRAQAPPSALTRLDRAVGARVAGSMNRGEPLTTARLQGAGIAAGLAGGTVAVSVRLDDSAAVGLIRAGDRVDLLASPESDDPAGLTSDPAGVTSATPAATARVLASSIRVLMIEPSPAHGGSDSGVTIVVAADQHTALILATATAHRIIATLRAPS